jgi:hypothetical protein
MWPASPTVISGRGNPNSFVDNNWITSLRLSNSHNRLCHFSLWDFPISVLESVAKAIQESFPELTYLEMMPHVKKAPVIPDTS